MIMIFYTQIHNLHSDRCTNDSYDNSCEKFFKNLFSTKEEGVSENMLRQLIRTIFNRFKLGVVQEKQGGESWKV